jgi:predicted Zn-dependent protease
MNRTACTLLVLLFASPAHAQLGGLLNKGVSTGMKIKDVTISDQQEVEIGRAVSERVRQRYGVVQDAAVHRYVALVGGVLAQSSARPGVAWQFIVLDTDGVNAFAAPGGYVHITRGALALLESEAELAGVLGHEIVHVTGRHTIRAIKNSKMKDLGLEESPSPSGGLTKAALDRLADEAYNVVYAGYGRSEELESDEIGAALVSKVGYDPKGLGTFLRRLEERNKNATGKQGLFASHPEMTERLGKLDAQIVAQKLTGTATLADRYKSAITYTAKAQAEIAQIEAGTAGLAGGASEKKDEKPAAEEPKKKRGFGIGSLLKPSGEEKKSAQVTGSGGSRGIDSERNATGGDNPALVAVELTPADFAAFKQEGNLT